MALIKLKENLGRSRVFTVINADGAEDTFRFSAGQRIDLDERLLTPELVKNVEKGALILTSGVIPKTLNPYPPKKADKPEKRGRGKKQESATPSVSDLPQGKLAKVADKKVEGGEANA